MDKKAIKIYKIVCYCLVILTIWTGVTTTIQRFITPKMTETELFMHIIKTVLLKFNS